MSVSGGRRYNPGWNLTTDLPAMLTVSRCTTLGAINRKESRGGHTRDDFPNPDPELGTVNFVQRITAADSGDDGAEGTPSIRSISVGPEPIPVVPDDLAELLEEDDLMAEELAGGDAGGDVTMRLWRGDETGGEFTEYVMPSQEGEVVLDVIHRVQATHAPDLACRWNCKAGKCGSCSAEINGRPALLCMTRMDNLPVGEAVTVAPMRTFPILRDLVTDVSYNYEVAKRIPPFNPRPKTVDEEKAGGYRMQQIDVERSQEFRKCIECYLCQNVCHVIRDHEENKTAFAGPRFFARSAELEMHPLDVNDRRELLRQEQGLAKCNITKCCTEVCPEHIKITDNAIIPLKERVVDASVRSGRLVGPQDPPSQEEHARRVRGGLAGHRSRRGAATVRGPRHTRCRARRRHTRCRARRRHTRCRARRRHTRCRARRRRPGASGTRGRGRTCGVNPVQLAARVRY